MDDNDKCVNKSAAELEVRLAEAYRLHAWAVNNHSEKAVEAARELSSVRMAQGKSRREIKRLRLQLEAAKEQLVKAEREIERLKILDESWRDVLFEINKTRNWRATTGMRPATDTSEFCMLPLNTLRALERTAKRALGE